MKTRSWILLLAAVFLVLAGIVARQYFGAKPTGAAEVYADGRLVRTLDLSEDGEYRIETDYGWNLLTVSIMSEIEGSRLGVASAYCVVLMIIVVIALLILEVAVNSEGVFCAGKTDACLGRNHPDGHDLRRPGHHAVCSEYCQAEA